MNILRLLPLSLMALLLALPLFIGCRRSPDPRLAAADALMEEHPDSALSILESYALSDGAADGDRAYYGLLLTHARYKNFIDETDDSLINSAAGYFERNGDREKAARALFLAGMIRMNAGNFGDAAVSFSKGLDLARDSRSYMWEGQCARGLYKLYGELHDGSAQVNYAKQANEAFRLLNDTDWLANSMLTLAIAYNNNCNYKEALSIVNQLEDEGTFDNDSLSLSHLYRLKGMSLFALGQHMEVLRAYDNSYRLNPKALSDGDRMNIQVAPSELKDDSALCACNSVLQDLIVMDSPTDAFVEYAREGKYKEAYESLEDYKNSQDSVLWTIFSNNVSESVERYRNLRTALMKETAMRERLSYWLAILLIGLTGIVVIWRIRERMHREKSARLKSEGDMESLRSDLLAQLDSVRNSLEKETNLSGHEASVDFEKIIRQRYAEANRLCDDYYQAVRPGNISGLKVQEEIQNIVRDFTEKGRLEKIAEYVDEKSGGLYSSFKKDYYHLPGDYHHLFLYLMVGLGSRTLSVILGQSVNAVYNRKSRLKAKIEQSEVAAKEDYLRFF